MRPRKAAAAACASMLWATALVADDAAGPPQPLPAETSLYTDPGVGLCGMLTAGTPVQVLERQGPWMRVRVEGWVRETATGTPVVVSTPAPVREPRATRGPTIEGTMGIKLGRKKKTTSVGTGAQIWLLPAAAGAELERETTDETETRRLQSLETEAASLDRQAADALLHVSNFTQATRTRDALLDRRQAALDERQQILATCHGRNEARARRAAIDSIVADGRGWFSFADTPPGTYRVYGRMIREGLDVEWLETVEVQPTGVVHLDLNETTARGLLREPS
jgi:hypothetical protein